MCRERIKERVHRKYLMLIKFVRGGETPISLVLLEGNADPFGVPSLQHILRNLIKLNFIIHLSCRTLFYPNTCCVP